MPTCRRRHGGEMKPFASFKPKPPAPTESDVVAAARQLLEEHAASREAATKAANMVCGACQGSGQAHSEIAGGVMICWACGGNGQPNDRITSLPALDSHDRERLYKLQWLLCGPHRSVVLKVIQEFMPDLYKTEGQAH